jgi:sulfite reductase (NADPH) hemoprotein beta-component
MSAPAKLRPIASASLVTANQLRDGSVVWLGVAGHWTPRLAEAAVFAPAELPAALAAAARAEAARLVVGAYAVEAEVKGGLAVPTRLRERLRANGPSIDALPRLSLPLAS